MAEFRLYFLNSKNHIIARIEFLAVDDATALRVAAVIGENSDDTHSGYMLWQGLRQIFAIERDSRALMRGLAAAPLSEAAQSIVIALEEQILGSHWALAQSLRLARSSRMLQARSPADSPPSGKRHRPSRAYLESSRGRVSKRRPRASRRARVAGG